MTWKVQNQTYGCKLGNLVDYVVASEFDINEGSTVRHQYPEAIPFVSADWLAENMIPEGIHNREMDVTYIFLNRGGACFKRCESEEDVELQSQEKVENKESGDHFLYGINVVCTKHDSSVRRGAVVKSMAIFTKHHWVESIKWTLYKALELTFQDSSITVLEHLYNALNAIDLNSLPVPSRLEKQIMSINAIDINELSRLANLKQCDKKEDAADNYLLQDWNQDFKIQLLDHQTTMAIPLYLSNDEVGDVNVARLVRTFGADTMILYNAIIRKQRIMFVGYGQAARDIAQMVFSTISLVTLVQPEVIKRTFPYATLTDLSFLEVPGYISGSTNPMFEQKDSWWDLLCVLDLPNDTGKVISKNVAAGHTGSAAPLSNNTNTKEGGKAVRNPTEIEIDSPEPSDSEAFDKFFITSLIAEIEIGNVSEDVVRRRFSDLTTSILLQAFDPPSLTSSSNVRLNEKFRIQFQANAYRASILKASSEFKECDPTLIWQNLGKGNEILRNHIRRLQCESDIHYTEIEIIFSDLQDALVTEMSLQVLLTIMPESENGLHSIAVGMLSISQNVRNAAYNILQRVTSFPSTSYAFYRLNPMLKASFAASIDSLKMNNEKSIVLVV